MVFADFENIGFHRRYQLPGPPEGARAGARVKLLQIWNVHPTGNPSRIMKMRTILIFVDLDPALT